MGRTGQAEEPEEKQQGNGAGTKPRETSRKRER